MLSVNTPPTPPQPNTAGPSAAMEEMHRHHHEIVLPDMDHLLSKLRRNMVELILQGDDVTRQMWRMYSVFEEIFGPQKISSKPVVVGDKIQQAAASVVSSSKTPATSSDIVKSNNNSPTLTTSQSPVSTANGANKTTAAAASSIIVTPTTTTCVAAVVSTAVIASLNTATTSSTAISTANCATSNASSFVTTSVCSSPVATVTATTITSSTPTTISSPSVCSDDATSRNSISISQTDRRIPPRSKNQRPASSEGQIMQQQQRPPEFSKTIVADQQSPGSAIPSSAGSSMQDITGRVTMPTSNPLLDTIGALAGSNPDSDDSDLDIVYQQLRYRGRHRRQDPGGRLKTQRSQRRHQQHFANSDPESTSYAGSNSIDSGYKSQCATPEVSDSLSAPEVRRSASDVSASDSSTTSGRPRSSDGGGGTDSKSVKIKMGTRAIAGKMAGVPGSKRRQPFLESSMNDVTLDHLMYLRQSMRKDYMQSSSQGSMPSSSASSTVRDELSPTILTDEESNYGQDMPLTPHDATAQRNVSPQRQRPYHSPTAYSPIDGGMFLSGGVTRSAPGSRSGRRLSSGSEPAPETISGSSPTSEDFLLSGMEYYDLDSVHDFPQRRSYFALMEEKSRCSRIHLMAASKRDVQTGQHDPFPKKRKDPMVRSMPADVNMYGISRHPHESNSVIMSHHRTRHHHAQQQQQHQQQQREIHHSQTLMAPAAPRGSDSKLTEAAIRVLQMIEDFRMEEAIGNATAFEASERGMRSNVTSVGPHAFVPRFRRTSGTATSRSAYVRPASTGSLIGSDDVPLDARSIASSSSYAASAEHHVYEEIMYDLVCERSGVRPDPHSPMGPVAHMGGAGKSRNRYLPANPLTAGAPHVYHHAGPERAMMAVRSHKHRSNMYSVITDEDPRNSPDPFADMEWNVPRGRRENIPPDYPV